jgi:hypothetical protein
VTRDAHVCICFAWTGPTAWVTNPHRLSRLCCRKGNCSRVNWLGHDTTVSNQFTDRKRSHSATRDHGSVGVATFCFHKMVLYISLSLIVLISDTATQHVSSYLGRKSQGTHSTYSNSVERIGSRPSNNIRTTALRMVRLAPFKARTISKAATHWR